MSKRQFFKVSCGPNTSGPFWNISKSMLKKIKTKARISSNSFNWKISSKPFFFLESGYQNHVQYIAWYGLPRVRFYSPESRKQFFLFSFKSSPNPYRRYQMMILIALLTYQSFLRVKMTSLMLMLMSIYYSQCNPDLLQTQLTVKSRHRINSEVN